MTLTAKTSSGKMTKKKKAKLRVVENGEVFPALKEQDVWDLDELTDKLKKARKRIKKLENALTVVNSSYDTLVEKHAALERLVETLDTRTQRMGMALRECMKKLGVERP